jgi:hypothetical protein
MQWKNIFDLKTGLSHSLDRGRDANLPDWRPSRAGPAAHTAPKNHVLVQKLNVRGGLKGNFSVPQRLAHEL